jgi:hypothetical protein
MLSAINSKTSSILEAVFIKSKEKDWPVLRLMWLIALYLGGIFLWGKFFSWNTGALDYHDWVDITMPRLAMLQNAFRAGAFPFHILNTAALHDISDRFLVLPDVITTPQTLLLLFVNLNTFVLIDVLMHYTIGMVGLLWLRSKKELSLFSFTVLFFLFNFNGYILAHYSVGHFTWGGYFLFPIVFGLIFQLIEGKAGWRWVFALSLTLFYIVLAGGQHHFVWLLLFITPLMLTSWKNARWILIAIIMAGLLSAVRFLPPVLALSEFETKQNFIFVLGYPSLQHLLQTMVLPDVAVQSSVLPFELNSFEENIWEFNFYIGLLGTVFILYFGIWHWFRTHLKEYIAFILPVFFVLFLSMAGNYWLIRASGIPLFGSERVTSRMVAVPMTFLMILSAIFFQKWLETHYERVFTSVAGGLFLVFLASDLWENLKLWRISVRASYFQPGQFDLSEGVVANHADPLYFSVLGIGLGITISVVVFLSIMSWREHRLQIKQSEQM